MRESNDMTSQPEYGQRAAPWDGVLPPPEVLKRYEDIVPGAANRILEAAERESRHHQNQEREVLELEAFALETAKTTHVREARRRFIGFLVIYVVSLLGIASSIYLILAGYQWQGLAMCGTYAAAMLASFVSSFNGRGSERLRRSGASATNDRAE